LIVYINQSHPLHLKAKKLFQRILKKEFKPVLSSQNLLELTASSFNNFYQLFLLTKKTGFLDRLKLFFGFTKFDAVLPSYHDCDKILKDFLEIEIIGCKSF